MNWWLMVFNHLIVTGHQVFVRFDVHHAGVKSEHPHLGGLLMLGDGVPCNALRTDNDDLWAQLYFDGKPEPKWVKVPWAAVTAMASAGVAGRGGSEVARDERETS